MYAIDGPFGLPRKKAAGMNHRKALQGHLFFCNQEDVDEFVGKSSNSKSRPKVGTEALTLQYTKYIMYIKSFFKECIDFLGWKCNEEFH